MRHIFVVVESAHRSHDIIYLSAYMYVHSARRSDRSEVLGCCIDSVQHKLKATQLTTFPRIFSAREAMDAKR